MFDRFFGLFSSDIGIDLGTANTLVYVRGRGVVVNEPSVVAINQNSGQVVAIGEEARQMVGRTPSSIVASRPLVDGVVSDFEVTEQMLRYFIDKVQTGRLKILARPRVVIGIPSGVTEVEKRAVQSAAASAGARRTYLIEEPMAAAIGARLPVQGAAGSMIVDIGGGTTEVAVISLGGIIASRSLRVAGDELVDDIIQFVRLEYNMAIGERTAEHAKMTIGSACPVKGLEPLTIRGRDLVSGLPKQLEIPPAALRQAMSRSISGIVEAVKVTIEETPPELLSDIMQHGIVLAGGGALLKGLDVHLSKHTGMPVRVADEPLSAVVRGTGLVLEDIDSLGTVLFSGPDVRIA